MYFNLRAGTCTNSFLSDGIKVTVDDTIDPKMEQNVQII